MAIELNCPTCANNRFDFPEKDSEPVLCQFCGDSIGTLTEVKKVADQAIKRARL